MYLGTIANASAELHEQSLKQQRSTFKISEAKQYGVVVRNMELDVEADNISVSGTAVLM